MSRLLPGDLIALAPGATELAEYNEWKEARRDTCWCASLWLVHGRLTCEQAWDDQRKCVTNRAWLRKRCAELLDSIAPGWQVVVRGGKKRRVGGRS